MVPFLNLISPFGLMGPLDVKTQPAINDDGGECSVKDLLIQTGQNRTFPVVRVKVCQICKKSSLKLRGDKNGMTKNKTQT